MICVKWRPDCNPPSVSMDSLGAKGEFLQPLESARFRNFLVESNWFSGLELCESTEQSLPSAGPWKGMSGVM